MGAVQIPEPGTSKSEAESGGCKTSETSLYQLVAVNKQGQLMQVFVVCQDYSFSPGPAAGDPPSRIEWGADLGPDRFFRQFRAIPVFLCLMIGTPVSTKACSAQNVLFCQVTRYIEEGVRPEEAAGITLAAPYS